MIQALQTSPVQSAILIMPSDAVIPAWMQESSAMDGNLDTSQEFDLSIVFHLKIHILVVWIPAQIRQERICIYPLGAGQDSPA